jgi:hypothetical protein
MIACAIALPVISSSAIILVINLTIIKNEALAHRAGYLLPIHWLFNHSTHDVGSMNVGGEGGCCLEGHCNRAPRGRCDDLLITIWDHTVAQSSQQQFGEFPIILNRLESPTNQSDSDLHRLSFCDSI